MGNCRMKKLIATIAISAMALGHTAATAQTAGSLDRAASPTSESEDLAGAAGIWPVILAVAAGIGIILLVEENEDDADEEPVSP